MDTVYQMAGIWSRIYGRGEAQIACGIVPILYFWRRPVDILKYKMLLFLHAATNVEKEALSDAGRQLLLLFFFGFAGEDCRKAVCIGADALNFQGRNMPSQQQCGGGFSF